MSLRDLFIDPEPEPEPEIDYLAIIEQHCDIRPITKDITQGPLTATEIDKAAIDKGVADIVLHKRRPDGKVG